MGFRVVEKPGQVRIVLDRWDMICCWRCSVVVAEDEIRSVGLSRRGDLEAAIDHRVAGIGTHDGSGRPGRRRVGVMMGRAVRGLQFWAAPASGPDSVLVVLDLIGHEFSRVVVSVTEPGQFRTVQ